MNESLSQKLDSWYQENKEDIAKQVEGVLADNKYRLMSQSKTKEEFLDGLEARGIAPHIALIAHAILKG